MFGFFSNNRSIIKQVFQTTRIISPINDNEHEVIEEKATGNDLKYLTIEGIPYSETSSTTNIWVYDFEQDSNVVLSTPSCCKMEQALIIFSLSCVYIILIELKSTVKGGGPKGIGSNGIEGKLRDSLAKLSLFATSFIFTEEFDYIQEIKYHAIVAYNKEEVVVDANNDKFIKDYLLYNPFLNSRNGEPTIININDTFGQNFNIKTHFIQNESTNPTKFSINIDSIIDEESFSNAIYQDFICP